MSFLSLLLENRMYVIMCHSITKIFKISMIYLIETLRVEQQENSGIRK